MVASDPSAESKQNAFAGRVFTVFLITAGLLSLLLVRLAWLMLVKHDEYRTRSDENRIQTMAMAPTRGLVYDRNGTLLAYNRPVFSLDVVAEQVDDMDETLRQIGTLVTLTQDELASFRAQLAGRRRPMERVTLKLDLSEEQRAIIEVSRHRLHGVYITAKTMRSYPFDSVMAHAVGSVRRITEEDLATLDAPRLYRATRFIGKRGVEAFYERSLHGEPGTRRVEVDVLGRERGELSRRKPLAGQNLTLHLDESLQIAASAALGFRRGAVVAIDPRSGGILALVSNPGYNPNLFVAGINPEQYAELRDSRSTPLVNRATRGLYAPGSTFKPIVGLAGLALGITDWQRTIDDRGEFRLPGQRRAWRDWNWRKGNSGGQGIVDLRRAIYRSSNVYFCELASRTNVDELPDFATQFGYGQVTAIDVADAHAGLLPDSEWKAGAKGEPWYPGDTINMSIGQGDLLVTPLQMATATAIIANRGRLVQPRMLKSSDGTIAEFAAAQRPGRADRIEGPTAEDWERMVDAMADVVHRGNKGYGQNGTAWAYIGQDIPYRMAGKSGTAQVVGIAQGEEYEEDELDEYLRKHAWFIAFAPTDEPRIAVAVLVENGGGGSSVAGPVARQVIDAYLLPELAAEQRPTLADRTPRTPLGLQ